MADTEKTSLPVKLIMWFIVGILVLIGIHILFWVLGIALGLVGFIIFIVLPIMLVGWLAIRLIKYFREDQVF